MTISNKKTHEQGYSWMPAKMRDETKDFSSTRMKEIEKRQYKGRYRGTTKEGESWRKGGTSRSRSVMKKISLFLFGRLSHVCQQVACHCRTRRQTRSLDVLNVLDVQNILEPQGMKQKPDAISLSLLAMLLCQCSAIAH